MKVGLRIMRNVKKQAVAPKTIPILREAFDKINDTEIRWLSSAGIMINSHGTVIMIDPLLEGFDLPLLVDMPIKSEEVPNLDAVLITHCDNDHFSRTTCKNLSNVCNSYHGPHYVAELMKEEGLNGIGHDIYESFKVGNLNVKLTPADHGKMKVVSIVKLENLSLKIIVDFGLILQKVLFGYQVIQDY